MLEIGFDLDIFNISDIWLLKHNEEWIIWIEDRDCEKICIGSFSEKRKDEILKQVYTLASNSAEFTAKFAQTNSIDELSPFEEAVLEFCCDDADELISEILKESDITLPKKYETEKVACVVCDVCKQEFDQLDKIVLEAELQAESEKSYMATVVIPVNVCKACKSALGETSAGTYYAVVNGQPLEGTTFKKRNKDD